jgi:hypothetical protein
MFHNRPLFALISVLNGLFIIEEIVKGKSLFASVSAAEK